jgi:predicted extracellular nuclease
MRRWIVKATSTFALFVVLGWISPASADGGGRHAIPRIRIPSRGHFLKARRYKADNRKKEYSVGTFNVQNLYHYRPGKTGEPRANYLPQSKEALKQKLKLLAATIVQAMDSPDIVALQEVENFKRNSRRKSASILRELVKEIKAQSPESDYDFTYSPGQSDRRGISTAFIYRKDRVKLTTATREDPLLGKLPKRRNQYNRTVANPKSLNVRASREAARDGQGNWAMARPLLAAQFEIFPEGIDNAKPGTKTEKLYYLATHFISQPHRFEQRRREAADFTAQLVRGIKHQDPNANVLVAGDMNADYNNAEHRKQIKPLEQLTPADRRSTTLLENLTARIRKEDRSTYRYRNHDNLIDWIYASLEMAERVVEVQIPHVNSKVEGTQGSDHDPVVARFRFSE